MKNLKRCLALVLVSFFCVILGAGCSKNLGDEDSESKDEATNIQMTKNYYKSNGYFELAIPEIMSAEINKSNYVYVENSLLVKSGVLVTLSVNEFANLNDFENASNLNFETDEVLDGFYWNGQTVNISEVNGLTFSMNEDVLISCNTKSFETIGAFVYCNYNETDSEDINVDTIFEVTASEIKAKDNRLFFAYFNNGLENISNKNKTTNDNCSVKLNEENGESFIDFQFEIPLETESYITGLILKTSDGQFLLINKRGHFDGEFSNLIVLSSKPEGGVVRVVGSKYFFL